MFELLGIAAHILTLVGTKSFEQEDVDTLKVLSSDYKVPSSETEIAKLSFIATLLQ